MLRKPQVKHATFLLFNVLLTSQLLIGCGTRTLSPNSSMIATEQEVVDPHYHPSGIDVKMMTEVSKASFESFDADGNQSLTREEMVTYYSQNEADILAHEQKLAEDNAFLKNLPGRRPGFKRHEDVSTQRFRRVRPGRLNSFRNHRFRRFGSHPTDPAVATRAATWVESFMQEFDANLNMSVNFDEYLTGVLRRVKDRRQLMGEDTSFN